MPFQSVQCHYLYTKPYCNWIDWPSLWRSNLCKKYCRIISHLSPAKPYLYPSHTMCFLNHTDGPLFPPLLSPLPLTTPPHHSDPTHPSSHHSPLSLLITPLTPIHTTPPLPHYFSLLPLTTSSHHSPHYSLSLPLTTPPHLPSSPHLLTTLFTTLFLTYLPNHTPLHHPLHPSPHHS